VIYLCIPAHDEAATVGVLLWKIRNVMTDFGRDFEILVVDDGSTDGTPGVLERYRSSLPLTVLRNETPVGYGASVDRLLREVVERTPYPKRDAAVVLQADFTEDPAQVVPLVKTLEGGADIVAGAEERSGRRARPRGEKFARWAAPFLLGSTYREAPVSDPLAGFRAYRAIVVKKAVRDDSAPLSSAAARWAANAQLLAALAPHARRIEEVPLSLRYHLMTRDSRFQTVPTLQELFRARGLDFGSAAGQEAS
jgi:glycosyltransferase involved in cell wall biosynthesis